jgi:hypothetical protein
MLARRAGQAFLRAPIAAFVTLVDVAIITAGPGGFAR